jgi:hypothetical protein
MRGLIVAGLVAAVAAGCTPRETYPLRDAPDAQVRAEPTVTGGAYDSVIYRVKRERGDTADLLHEPADAGHDPAAAGH